MAVGAELAVAIEEQGGKRCRPEYLSSRCRVGDGEDIDHFLSTSSSCEGQRSDGVLGHIWTSAGDGRVALKRCYNGASHDHMSSIDAAECTAGGYKVERTLGWVYRLFVP